MNLQFDPGKCEFARTRVKYLGYTFSSDGLSTSAVKVRTVKQYPVSKNAKDVRSYLDLHSFSRRLIPIFTEVAKTLKTVTTNNQPFVWVSNVQEAFEEFQALEDMWNNYYGNLANIYADRWLVRSPDEKAKSGRGQQAS